MRLHTQALGQNGYQFLVGSETVAIGEYRDGLFWLTDDKNTTKHVNAMQAYALISAQIRDIRGDLAVR